MDDFTRADTAKLSRAFDNWAENIGFGKSEPSIILMSKDKVEELKRMKFAKVTNDRDFPVEVNYKDADGKEVKETIEPGAELEVPSDAADAIKSQVADATAPEPRTTEPEPGDPTPADP